MSKYRGHSIDFLVDVWVYSDTKELVTDTHMDRPCGNCNKPATEEGHDGCLGTLPGVINACCGHGNTDEAYIQFLGGVSIYGEYAKTVLNILKKRFNG